MQPKTLSTRLSILLILFLFPSCNPPDVPRPNSEICENNVLLLKSTCYNLLTDYDDNGNLLPNAKPVTTYYPDEHSMILALNKSISTDPQGWANIKAYIRNLRAANGS